MRSAGIIAAGDGTRLAGMDLGLIKPLVPVAGRALCHWVALSLRGAGARELTVLHNSRGRSVRQSLTTAFPDLRWNFLEADTASSWESFRLVASSLSRTSEQFLISAVDSLIPPEQSALFAAEMSRQLPAAGLALTSFVDDEKPLWADLDHKGLITALGERASQRQFVTAGLYYLTSPLVKRMPQAQAHGRLRDYWMSLVAGGEAVAGAALTKTIDVDRPEDIREADNFLKQAGSSW